MSPATRKKLTNLGKASLLPVALLGVAEFAMRTFHEGSFTLAPPTSVLTALISALFDGSLLHATAETLISAAVGLLIGGTIGLAIGILFGLFQPMDQLMKISVESIRPIPSIALIPIGMMIAGVGYSLEISVVAFTSIWPTLILARAAVLAVEPQLLEVARVLNLGFAATITKIVLPSILPRLFVAIRLAIGFSLIVAVTTEIVANPIGLGYGMLNAQQSMQPSLMLAFLTWIGVIGWTLSQTTVAAQQWLFGKWDSK